MDSPYKRQPFAKKSFGQNFLVDDGVIAKIVAALRLVGGETVIEIGSGRGALTETLIQKAGRVIAIELDRDLIPVLHARFGLFKNFELVDTDALKANFEEIAATTDKVKLVANLPYNISTAILQRLSDQRHVFSELILMFQREVVERITARAGHKERGFLSVLVEANFDSEKLFDVPGKAFRPVPKVMSSVVRLTPKDSEIADKDLFRKIVSKGFLQKRKTIFNNFKSDFSDAKDLLEMSGIDPNRRAETLTLDEWINLVESVANGNLNSVIECYT
ncbi:MAG: ribosomal RNA small subunit methyltransferase A [Saprospiraceae bacterium]|nr:ribosomal RNA small subunit methyltransferase A [Pyrinomonadaceae bacterium]